MSTVTTQTLYAVYAEVFWQAAPGSGLEEASRQIVDVLSGDSSLAALNRLVVEAREAVVSALEHRDIGAFTFFAEKIALYDLFLAQMAQVSS